MALIYALFALWRQQSIQISELTRQLTPAFSLSTDKGGPIVAAIERQYDRDGHFLKDINSRYVRIRADARSRINIHDGIAYITGLTKRPLNIADSTEIPLPQSVLLHDQYTPFTIYHAVPKMIDFLKVDEENNKLIVIGFWPIILEHVFNDTGFYTFTITVNAGNAGQSRKVEVMWNGNWNQITARDVTDENR